MRVISIDPGYDRLGVAILEYQNGKETLLYSACIESNRIDTMSKRLAYVGEAFAKLLTDYQPNTLGIETLFFNKNVKTALGVAEARGVFLYLAERAGCAIYEFGPQTVKTAVTGYGNSDKHAVIAMLPRLINNVPAEALDDEYDAIAIGIACLATYGRNR